MCPETRGYKFADLMSEITLKRTNSWNLRYWAALHQEDQLEVEKMLVYECDPRIRQELVRKLTNQAILYSIATEDENVEIQKIAIGNISDKSYLLRLRMILDPMLQPYVKDQVMKLQALEGM